MLMHKAEGQLCALQVLQTEQDLSTKRNAFQMLCNHAQPLAVNYLLSQAKGPLPCCMANFPSCSSDGNNAALACLVSCCHILK